MAAGTTTSRVPDVRFLLSHPAHFIALGFGSGLAPRAPGTFGTLAAWAIYWIFALFLPPLAIAFIGVPVFFLGVWAAGVTARGLRRPRRKIGVRHHYFPGRGVRALSPLRHLEALSHPHVRPATEGRFRGDVR